MYDKGLIKRPFNIIIHGMLVADKCCNANAIPAGGQVAAGFVNRMVDKRIYEISININRIIDVVKSERRSITDSLRISYSRNKERTDTGNPTGKKKTIDKSLFFFF